MAEDKIKVSGKSPGIWTVQIDGKWKRFTEVPVAQLLREIDERDLVEVSVGIGTSEQVVELGSNYTVTFRIKSSTMSGGSNVQS